VRNSSVAARCSHSNATISRAALQLKDIEGTWRRQCTWSGHRVDLRFGLRLDPTRPTAPRSDEPSSWGLYRNSSAPCGSLGSSFRQHGTAVRWPCASSRIPPSPGVGE
jgi:hypothetical protein